MSSVIAHQPTRAPAFQDRAAADNAATAHGRRAELSWLWALVEALAYAGSSIDPSAALAARRFARIRDEQLRSHR